MTKTFARLLFLGLILLSFSQNTCAQQNVDYSRLDAEFRGALEKFKLPGMAIAIVKDGEIVFQNGYGFRNIEKNEKVSVNTNFGIASVSKAFAAAAMAKLVEEGKVNWNDRVIDWLPYFKLHDPVATRLMTVEDLLCHRSGLNTFDGDLLTYGTYYNTEDVLKRIGNLPLTYDFRTTYGYQNIMFIAAGEVIKAASGKDWFTYVNEDIFKPLGMKKSNTSVRQYNEKSEIATPYVFGKADVIRNYDNWSAAASINSNVGDMAKWIQMWTKNGMVESDTFLTEKSIRKLWEQHTILPVSAFDAQKGIQFKSYGLGWFISDYKGKKIVEHGGGLPGYISKICIVPSENLGFIILTNGETYAPYALMYEILDRFLGGEKNKWVDMYLGFSKNKEERLAKAKEERMLSRATKTKPSHSLDAYTGRFEDKMYGPAEVKLKGNQLSIELIPSKTIFTGDLKHWHYDTFEVKFLDPFLPEGYITFEFDSRGGVSGFKIDLPNPDFNFYNLHFIKNK